MNRVQTNLVDKTIFDGEWWFTNTVVDVTFDEAYIFSSAGAFAPFEGSMASDYGADYSGSFPISRIRWVIDETYLFAYRSFELVVGGNDDGRSPEFRGQPVAAFPIEAHVDVRREYNSVTGEATNVISENSSDRQWYERHFMRVDWSQNVITEFVANSLTNSPLFTSFHRESVPLFAQEGSRGFDETYYPQFLRVSEDPGYRFADEWPEEDRDTVHYMSFVTREVWSPGAGCLTAGGICASANATMRNSFLRVPPLHEYAAASSTHREFDRFGIFRSEQTTYARGGQDKAVQRNYCAADEDCGPGGSCDLDRNICVGGLTEDRGETDFLTFYRSRHNLYADSLTDVECVSDWECDGRYDRCDDDDEECATQSVMRQGSECDRAARRCTIPLRNRPLRAVDYRLTKGFPPYLVRQAFEAVAQWNEALMRGQRAVEGLLPIDQTSCDEDEELDVEGSDADFDGVCSHDLAKLARVDCQEEDPAKFCFCGSPEDERGVCTRRYDPFESPEQARERGVPNPYDCYVEGPSDEPHPQKYTDYDPGEVYGYRFVGDECMLTLRANGCDVDPEAPCEELGDLRYQFLAHIQHGAVGFGGVAQPMVDPRNGELIVSNASVAAESIESVATLASQFFPVLRGEVSEDEYFDGEHVRGYYGRLGRVDHPVAGTASGTDGYSVDDSSRPEGVGASAENQMDAAASDVYADMRQRLESLAPKLEQLRGEEGRAAILSDRLLSLAGSNLEARLSSGLTSDAEPDLEFDEPMSLVEDSPLQQTLDERRRRQVMAERNMDDFAPKLFNSQYWQYWADALADVSLAEASLRTQQVYFRSVMVHEVGHALGLRHNFAGSLDRNQYHDPYFRIARQVPLPSFFEYDDPSLGGNGDGFSNGEEAQRWADALRGARQTRLEMGAGNVMTSSVMDYDGDLSGLAGMGRYDAAAVMFNYFNRVEAYSSGDPTEYPGTLSAAAEASITLMGLEHADSHRRELWTYYRGGDSCTASAECPHSSRSETTIFQPITQRCVTNPRDRGPTEDCDGQANCVCSNFYDDFEQYMQAEAYRSSSAPPEYAPVEYLYCTDERQNDLSWCTTFDAGESFQEAVDHYRLSWLQRYPSVYFRNYRRSGPRRGYSLSSVVDAVKIYQHLFFRLNFEDAFRGNIGPLGEADQFFASIDVLNWLGEIIGSPDVGSYALDRDANIYRQISTEPGAAGSDLDLEPGQGFYLWSQYQEGLNGFYRLQRAGTFLDKLLAIEAVARRDWGLSFTIDERYFINFYDVFDQEVIDMFGGLVLRNPKAYAPRVSFDPGGEPTIEYLSMYRSGDRGNTEQTYTRPALDGTDSEVLRDAAAIQALATFPIFYDTSFEQRLLIFRLGSGEGYEIPATREDGSPTCGHGDPDCPNPDFITYDSDRLHTTFVAAVINPGGDGGIDEQQLGYQLLLKLNKTQDRIRTLEAKGSLNVAQRDELLQLNIDLERDESFVDYLIELARLFGISTYLYVP